MEVRTEKRYILIFFIALFFALTLSMVQNIENPWIILTASGVFLLSFTFRNTSFTTSREGVKYLSLLELLLISDAFFVDFGAGTAIFFFILAANILLLYDSLFSGIFTGLSFIIFIGLDYSKAGFPEISGYLPSLMDKFCLFAALYVMARLIRMETIQKKKLRETMFQLKVKTKQSEDMVMKLKETTSQLEEMTAIQERNRIAREIHDTVGHTLTTVLIEIEAGQRLMLLHPEEADKKLTLAKDQVRKGLDSLRESVRVLKEGHELKDLTHSMTLLIQETVKHGNVFIRHEISPLPPMSPEAENILYRALVEGLTNGMKHGGSTAFVFQLKAEPEKVGFFLEDNGKGAVDILFGYGLTAMKEGVEELGGTFSVRSAPGAGFTIQIELPLQTKNLPQRHGG